MTRTTSSSAQHFVYDGKGKESGPSRWHGVIPHRRRQESRALVTTVSRVAMVAWVATLRGPGWSGRSQIPGAPAEAISQPADARLRVQKQPVPDAGARIGKSRGTAVEERQISVLAHQQLAPRAHLRFEREGSRCR